MTLSEIAELYHGRFDNFVSVLYYDDNDDIMPATELMDVFRFKSRDGGQAENTLNIYNAAIHIKHEIAFDEEPNSDGNPATIRTSNLAAL